MKPGAVHKTKRQPALTKECFWLKPDKFISAYATIHQMILSIRSC